MANIDWYVEGLSFGNCICNHSCPCQFEDRPTYGNCQGFEVLRIDEGHFADTDLGGLKVALLYSWPGAIFEGNGEMQTIVDERADEAQRAALAAIMVGEGAEPGMIMLQIYAAMCPTKHETIARPIDVTMDMEARTGALTTPEPSTRWPRLP